MTSPRHLFPLIALFVAPLLTLAPASAQDEGPEISRADLATAYLRLETALKNAQLDEPETIRVNKAFDVATLQFFAGKMAEAIQQIDALTASLHADGPAALAPASLRASIAPPVFVTGTSAKPMLTLTRLYPYPEKADEDPIHVTVAAEASSIDMELGSDTLDLSDGSATVELEANPSELAPGRYEIALGFDGTDAVQVGQWSVVPESLDALAARNAEQLESIEASTPALEQAKASCAARNALLSDNPSPENTAQLLFDPNQLAAEIAAEIAALAEGDNPYANRKGDYWRVLKIGENESPMRVYLPDSAGASEPLPLVVAFHGAGGDENMFMDAYGAGIIKETANKHGFLLVTPRTYDYGGSNIGEMFDALVEAIGYDYDIDPDRIYVLGHSMGGGATNNLINARPNMIAAAAPICGFRQLTTSAEETPPTLIIAAELDPLARPERVQPGAQKAIDEGLPVEYKLIKNYGHTLVVGDIMQDTIDWLLKHKRE